MDDENKYHFAREVLFSLRAARAINEKVYLHWVDKLNQDEKNERGGAPSESDISKRIEELKSYEYKPKHQ